MLDRLLAKHFQVTSVAHAAAILEQDFSGAANEIEESLENFEIPITEIIGSGGGQTLGTQRLRDALYAQGWKKTIFQIKKSIRIWEKHGTGEAVQIERESTTHEIDHVKPFQGNFEGTRMVALEIEWNNKDPFFDRDLENFNRLHNEQVISAGIIITRGQSLQQNIKNYVYRYATEQNIQSFADLDRLNIEINEKRKRAIQTRTTRRKNPVPFLQAWTDNFIANKYGKAQTHWDKLIARINRGVGHPCPLLLIGLPDSIVRFDVNPVVEPIAVDAEEAVEAGEAEDLESAEEAAEENS